MEELTDEQKQERTRHYTRLRVRRARKRQKALEEGKPEDFYIIDDDYADYAPDTEQGAAMPARTRQERQDEPDTEQVDYTPLRIAGAVTGGALALIGIVAWMSARVGQQ